MNTEVAILHHDYPAETRATVDKRLQGLTRFFDGIHSLSARLEKQGDEHRVELVAHVGRGPILKAEVTQETFKGAVDECVDRMRGQLSRHRGRVKLSKHRPVS
ncbi:MAG: HPF/RaiA family ribosome-associated protein [Planctomycetota bacterium]|jgi:ribosomal subunit interface protein|nr:HPF/RaiA family ribosome-associated protein [Planctomycetota bacterium]